MVERLLAAGADANVALPEARDTAHDRVPERQRRGRAGPHRRRRRRERGRALARPDRVDVGGGTGSRRRCRHPRAPRRGCRRPFEVAPAADARRQHQRVAVRPGRHVDPGRVHAVAVRGAAGPGRGGGRAARRRRRREQPEPHRRDPARARRPQRPERVRRLSPRPRRRSERDGGRIHRPPRCLAARRPGRWCAPCSRTARTRTSGCGRERRCGGRARTGR